MSDKKKIIAENEFKSNLSLVPEIQDFVIKKISKFIPSEKSDAVLLAISEAISNGIKHGNKSDENKKLKIIIELSDEAVFITVQDEGKGFKFDSVPDPTNPENIMKESGRGIFIMRNVADNLSYEFTNEGTKTILEIKRK